MSKPDIYCFYPNIEIVKGYSRSVVFDIFKCSYFFLPKRLANFFAEKRSFSIGDLIEICDGDDNAIDLIEYFKRKQIISSSFSTELFECEKRKYDFPGVISNAIVEINKIYKSNYPKLFQEISDLGCHSIELRFIDFSNELLNFIFENLNSTKISSYNVFVPIIKETKAIVHWFESNQKLLNLVMLSNNGSSMIPQLFYEKLQSKAFILDNSIDGLNEICGKLFHPINTNSFHFLESKSFNNCLNKKVCVDFNGRIKNCLAFSKEFGDAFNDLRIVVNSHLFQAKWDLTKDEIDVCKSCEFRYLCKDCRANIKHIENIFSQPAKCTYNPYIAKWQGEDGYVPVEECGTYSRETGFVVNHKRVAELNELLWG